MARCRPVVSAGLISLCLFAFSAPASEAPTPSLSLGGKGLSKREDRKWIRRWAPERNMLELGVYGGLIFPAPDHELFDFKMNRPQGGFLRFNAIAPEVGARFGYFPSKYFGIEAEGGYAPVQIRDIGLRANLWAARGHLVGQLGWWSVTPFVLVGGGVLAVASPDVAVGQDVDQALHFGFGSKFFLTRYLMARIEVRDVVAPRRGVASGASNTIEVLLGISITLGRDKDRNEPEPEPKPEAKKDQDGDGIFDDVDECPVVPGDPPTGCPDVDADGVLDRDDKCPEKPGDPPSGCPDTDLDGFLDNDDRCPEVPGVAPNGCPEEDDDPDKDGLRGTLDACPKRPETVNGYKDTDGCPDELPDDLGEFTGAIEGVQFKTASAKLRTSSRATLNKAVEVLTKYKNVRVEISGHTDSEGKRSYNMELSRLRADTVRKYLLAGGIDESRIETRGAGPDEPVDTNRSKTGRAKNRRIEFRILE